MSPEEESPQMPYPTAAKAGCGLACLCILGESLGGEKLSMAKCVELSVAYVANRDGTDMQKLDPVMAERDGMLWILDPSYSKEKYAASHRIAAVRIEYPYVVASLADVARETQNRSPSYYLFTQIA